MYRRCLRLLGDREAARDATQEVFVKLVRDIGRLADRHAAVPWIFRVAANHCLTVLRGRRRRSTEPRAIPAGGAAEGPQDLADRQLAQRVLARFDAKTQVIAVGVLVDGMEHDEVAGALGISRRTVDRKLARFLERARRLAGGEP